VIESAGAVTIFSDGVPTLSSQDPALAEEIVHFPLSQVDRPRRLLLVSAVGGMMAEVAKYRPDRVDYVELDPLAAQLQLRFGLLTPIRGLTVIAQDARAYLVAHIDAVRRHPGQPAGAGNLSGESVLHGRIFRAGKKPSCTRRCIQFRHRRVANYISAPGSRNCHRWPIRPATISSMSCSCRGSGCCLSAVTGRFETDIPLLLEQKGIETRHIRRYYAGDLTDQRIRQLNDAVDPDIGQNLDLSPRLMRLGFVDWFARHGESPGWFALALSLPRWLS
jgi:spermidine synthase